MTRAVGMLALVLALAGCRQLFGIEDTEVAADADPNAPDAVADAPPGTADGRPGDVDAPPGTPDGQPDATPSCPASYTLMHDGHRYRLSLSSTSWSLALGECDADLAGNYLVVPDNENENDFLAALDAGDVWIGVNDLLVEGSFVTVDGQTIPPHYQAWQAGEPDGGTTENCVYSRTSAGGNDGAWETRACDNQRRYLCECPF